ncbi:hypothetical protein CWI37_1353p0010 [Hamiltosporidium tvaerminnensis]|uniref:Uncharacterized protein n=1 Tax=Hamiltosporidium tvaerminnensis TaxID=1176355 RepID=A0A4Q9KYC0_9MICR|nr:hypothetical protein CWI37_1353p0010 [Hamiltosporidium tvaerminnensis]
MLSKRLPPQPIIDNNTPFCDSDSIKKENSATNDKASMSVIMRAEMRGEAAPSLKQAIREGNGAKNSKKNNTLFISERGTTFKEPTIDINKESELEEETTMVKYVK